MNPENSRHSFTGFILEINQIQTLMMYLVQNTATDLTLELITSPTSFTPHNICSPNMATFAVTVGVSIILEPMHIYLAIQNNFHGVTCWDRFL